MTDLKVFGNVYAGVKGIKATDISDAVVSFEYSINDIIERKITGDVVYNSGSQTALRDGLFEATEITSFTSTKITGAERGYRAFAYCPNLKSVSMPNLNIGSNTSKLSELFTGCSNLESAYLPNIGTNWSGSAFEYCSKLTSVNIDRCTTLPQSTFHGCYMLPAIDLPNCALIYNTAFSDCRALETVILRSSTLCTVRHTNAFSNTPLTGYGGVYSGHVYVPSALLETYKTTTNWSTFYANYPDIFRTIEGSIYETQRLDGTPIE